MFSNILLRIPQPSTEYDKDQKQHLQNQGDDYHT